VKVKTVQQVLYFVCVGGGVQVFLFAGGFVYLKDNAKINGRCVQ
jgi:hypothetical protein